MFSVVFLGLWNSECVECEDRGLKLTVLQDRQWIVRQEKLRRKCWQEQ